VSEVTFLGGFVEGPREAGTTQAGGRGAPTGRRRRKKKARE